jgi:hypothetical protein
MRSSGNPADAAHAISNRCEIRHVVGSVAAASIIAIANRGRVRRSTMR